MDTQLQVTDPESKIIQIEVPGDMAIFYFEGGVKTALESMEQTRKFLENSNDQAGVSKLNVAVSSMGALLDVTREVKSAIISESQQIAMEHAIAQAKQVDQRDPGEVVQAAFAPSVMEQKED